MMKSGKDKRKKAPKSGEKKDEQTVELSTGTRTDEGEMPSLNALANEVSNARTLLSSTLPFVSSQTTIGRRCLSTYETKKIDKQ